MGMAAAIVGAGALSAGASIGSGLIGASAAKSAAKTQAQAADQAAQLQWNEFQQTQANLAPYVGAGTKALTNLTGALPGLTAPFQPSMAQLAQTPGYQFTQQQGLQATQNSFAAQGLGTSGAALKGASNYAEQLAATTYQQQFQNYLTQNQQIYSMLSGVANIGQNAAAMTGTQGLTAAGNAGQFLTSGAAAGAAGTIGAASSIGGALSGVGSAGTNTALLLALNNSGLFGSGAST